MSTTKRYFYNLGRSAGRDGLPASCYSSRRATWPTWAQAAFIDGLLDGWKARGSA